MILESGHSLEWMVSVDDHLQVPNMWPTAVLSFFKKKSKNKSDIFLVLQQWTSLHWSQSLTSSAAALRIHTGDSMIWLHCLGLCTVINNALKNDYTFTFSAGKMQWHIKIETLLLQITLQCFIFSSATSEGFFIFFISYFTDEKLRCSLRSSDSTSSALTLLRCRKQNKKVNTPARLHDKWELSPSYSALT